MASRVKMSGPSPVMTSAPSLSMPLSSPVSAPLKKGDEDEMTRSLRPTLSFRQRPEPPKPPSQILNVEDQERPLRPTLSFRQKPEPPQTRGLTFQEPVGLNTTNSKEKTKEMQKTKSKMDMLQNLLRESASRESGSAGGAPPGASPEDSSSDEEDSGDEAISLSQATGGKILIRPSAPPPPPPGLSQISSLPPLPKVMIKAPPAPPPLPPPSKSPILDTPDDNAAENWQTMWSPEQNRNYYYNKKTGVSTWEDPNTLKPARSTLTVSRSNDLEKKIHKKTMEKPKDDDEVDVFGRSTANRGSAGSSGSQSSGRMSLRATLSKAFGLGAKKPSSPLRTSDSAKESSEPFATNRLPSPISSDVPQPTEINSDFFRGNGSMRSNGSLISFSSAVSHESENSTRSHEKPIKDKHAEVVAEVHTKAGRHTIVRAKKGKKKDHSVALPTHTDPAYDPAAAQYGLMQQVQQQALQRPPSSPRLIPATYGVAPPQMQHFGAPHPQQMTAGIPVGGPTFLQPPPFAAYAQFTPPSPRQFVPPTPSHPPPTFTPAHAAPPSQIQAPRYVQALYDFFPSDPNNPSEIGLRRGDVVQLMDQGVDGWWEGIHLTTGRRGLFPGSHVQYVS